MKNVLQSLRSRSADRESADAETGQVLNYHSFPAENPTSESNHLPSRNYRGFSSSINDMFVYPEHERVDCCAIACCGVLQADRDRYLLLGIKPPSCFRRLWYHIMLPILIFLAAGFCAIRIKDVYLNSFTSTSLLLTLVAYLIIQCFKGMWKRRHVRKELLWTKYHLFTSGEVLHHRTEEDSIEEAQTENPPAYYMGQTRSDMQWAHAPCGCYVRDRPLNEENDGDQDRASLCTRFFQCYTNSCCGLLCGMHLQICGICAVAQEARQVESTLHEGYLRIDYITMQPMLEYYPAIYEARNSETTRSWWWQRLSRLSKWVLGVIFFFLMLLLIWSFSSAKFKHKFGPKNFTVLCATLLQAMVFLFCVYCKHTNDVSADALIKFFACGFCLSTTLAVFFEMVAGLTMRFLMSLLMAMSGIDVVTREGFTDMMIVTMPGFGNAYLTTQESGAGNPSYRDLLLVFGKKHPFMYTVYLFLNAFCLAAVIEELSKYFGYRMVDHPDFLTKNDLDEAAECYFDEEEDEGRRQEDAPDFSRQDRSLQSRGAAITVSMVAVALGFACCENLIYIFVYGEATLAEEVAILLARSLFPVHPIAAALQSIGVCEATLEKNAKLRLGRIILPAVLFHGFYDFFLMWIDFLGTRQDDNASNDDANDESLEPSGASDVASLLISMLVIAIGCCYYYRQSRRQRDRLAAKDSERRETPVNRSSLL